MRKYKTKELRDLVRLGVAEDYTNSRASIFTRCAGLKKWAILPAFMVSMAGWSKIQKPAHYTPLSGVVPICSSCFKGV